MGPAARQFGALLWKNWLCRRRHTVLSLAEFLWPCILFVILTVLRLQEPPRHRDTCYLQPRDLPSRGVFPFVHSLLCNTGSRCRNSSYAQSMQHHVRSSRFRTAAGRPKINALAFLQEVQDLGEEMYDIMDKAEDLQKLWAERSTTPDSTYGSGFLTRDLNKTEEVIAQLESLHQQPHLWEFLRLLPRLHANNVRADDGIRGGVHLLQAVLNSITSLEDSGGLPLSPTFWKVSENVLNGTILMLTFLQEHGVAATALLEEPPRFEGLEDWKITSDDYVVFLKNLLKSPVASISRVLNSTKALLMMEKKSHALEDEQTHFFLSLVEFMEKLLLPNFFYSSSVPKFHNPPPLPETILNTTSLWINHLKSLEGEPPGIDTLKLIEFGKEMIEKLQTLGKKDSRCILRLIELILFEINPKLLELWMCGISKGERAKLETLSTLLNFSVSENERILSKSFNSSQLFHSDWPKPPAAEVDFVHLSEAVITSLCEGGFLRQEQVPEALDVVYAVRNLSDLFSALSEPQQQAVDRILMHMYLQVFKGKDSALLLHIYSSFYQYIYNFLSFQRRESLLSFLTQISKQILDIINQFNFQNISKALEFLYETTEVLGRISEVSYCQQLLSIFSVLELQAQSLRSTEGPESEVIHATLTGLKQLLLADEGFRISLLQYTNQLFNSSVQVLLSDECFALSNKSTYSANYSVDGAAPFTLSWAQILSNFSRNGSEFNEFLAIHCTISWLRMWTEIWAGMSQILKVDMNVFTPLHAGLTQLLDELESDVNISTSCQGTFPTHRSARLILNLLENVTQADGFHDWGAVLNLRDLWVALGDALVRVKSLNLDQVEKSLVTMETALSRLKAFPLNTSASREFFYSLLDLFLELSNTSEYTHGNLHVINHFLSHNLTHYEVEFESIITVLRETILFLRNVSHDQDLLSCADIFQNVTQFVLEDGLLSANASRRTLHILAMLSAAFSSEDTTSRLEGCVTWVNTVNHLHGTSSARARQGHLQGVLKSFRDVGNKTNSTLKLVTWLLNIMESGCSLSNSSINCVTIYLKNLTDLLDVILSTVFEKEKVPKSEVLLSLLNDSTNPIRMIINNLTRDFEFASQSNWKHFTELILRPIEMPDEIPSKFQNIWLHLVDFGKEMKKLANDIFPNVLENNSSSEVETFVNTFATSLKEKDINSLGNSFSHLVSYLAFNSSPDLQHSPPIVPREIMKAVGLGIQLFRDVFNSLRPPVHRSRPEEPGSTAASQKAAPALRALRNRDVALLVHQLRRAGESLGAFSENVTRLGTGSSGVGVLVGLVETLVGSAQSWTVNHLLRLSRLFRRDDLNASGDVSYALPHAARLLRRVVDKNVTEALREAYGFTLLHGRSISNVTKEVFSVVIKTLSDTIELLSDGPGLPTEALSCLPVIWCQNLTTSGFQQNPKSEACNGQELRSFYSQLSRVLEHLHLSPRGEASLCSNESAQMEAMRRVVCGIHELVDWSSILLELSEVFRVKTPLVRSVQEFWRKVLPFVPSSGNQSHGSRSGLCPTGPVKQAALHITGKLKNVSFTEATSGARVLHTLAGLNRILSLVDGTEAPASNVSFNLDRTVNLLPGGHSLEDSPLASVPLLAALLKAARAGGRLEALSGFTTKGEAASNLQELWLAFEQTTKDLRPDLNTRPLFSAVNEATEMTPVVFLRNLTSRVAHLWASPHTPPPRAAELTEDLLWLTSNGLRNRAHERPRTTRTAFLRMANRSSAAEPALLTRALAAFLGFLGDVSGGGDVDGAPLRPPLSPAQRAGFSATRQLLARLLLSSAKNLAGELSAPDLQTTNVTDLPLNGTQSEKAERVILPAGSGLEFREQLPKALFSFLQNEPSENGTALLLRDLHQDALADLRLVHSLRKTLFAGNPVMTFLSNFTVTADVKVKDLVKNVTELTEELRSSIGVSDETLRSVLEANISHGQVLPSALAAALSGRCDRDTLRLLLTFPEDEASRRAVAELCGLPGAAAYTLVLSLSRGLDLRSLVYRVLMPAEAHGALASLLDVVSRLSRLLPRAGRVLDDLPEFFHALDATALLDAPDLPQAPPGGQARSPAPGSLQSLMKTLCQDQAPFLSDSHTVLNLPKVSDVLGGDTEKFNIPEDSTPFCLKLYQEILQAPNGALAWAFLKPLLHGKVLYTPDTPEVNELMRKANHTFSFVDTLRTVSAMLLNVSSAFQSDGGAQALTQLQEALGNRFIRNFVESQLHINVDELTEKLQTYRGAVGRLLSHPHAGRIRFLGHVLVNLSSCVELDRFQAMSSVAALEATAQELMRRNSLLASVIFRGAWAGRHLRAAPRRLPSHVTYTIRTSTSYSMRTDVGHNPLWKSHPQRLPADAFKYNYVFVPLQDMIERAIILVQTGQDAVEPAAQAQATPYPCHRRDLFLNNVGFFFPLIMVLTWIVSVASMVRKLVYEREMQLEEYLRMMGVHPAAHFLAWFLENVAVGTLSSAALAAVLRASGIFAHSDAGLVFLFLLDFGVSVVMLSYFLSTFFSQASTAAVCCSLAYMMSFLPYIALLVLHTRLPAAAQTALCLLPTTAFGQGVFFVTFLEGQEEGVQWGAVYRPPLRGGITFGCICWMILFDSGLYFLGGWYLSNWRPGAFGFRRPWYFPFTASYWKDVCGPVARRPRGLWPERFFRGNLDSEGSPPPRGKGEPGGGPPGVTLVSVTKEYPPHKAAVQDLSLSFHSDQITALLGTNGAGKTTVISLLTGLHPPTSGSVVVNGRDLRTHRAAERRELGVCPQRDVLLENLTVREHLLLFAAIKAPQWTWAARRQQVDRTLGDLGLGPHQHTLARALSGGLKRRLSVGMAFLGAPRTVVLDEPTSGVDPCSRRRVWDMLLKHRQGRTIIFTTHHLDEAEALSDRVAILQRGRLRCCGSPSCLMEAHGQGLSLTLTRQPAAPEDDGCEDVARATRLIQTHVPGASLRHRGGWELRYAVPKAADPARLRRLFRALEQNRQRLRLSGYRVSDPTLEEVFLTLLQDPHKRWDVGPGPGLEPPSRRPAERAPGHDAAPARPGLVRGCPLLLDQGAALLAKRLCLCRRAWRGALRDLLLPVLFVAVAMALLTVRPLAVSYPPLTLTAGHYGKAETYFFSSDSDDLGLAQALVRQFGAQGLRCADPAGDPRNSSCWSTDPVAHPELRASCGCRACPNASAGAPRLTSRRGRALLNLSALRPEEYLLLPSETPRLGGWAFGVRIPGPAQDASSNTSKPSTVAKVWYNQKALHALPSCLNHLNNLILRRLLPGAADRRPYGITLYSHPYGGALLSEDKILESVRQCGVALCVVLGFSVLSASIGTAVVRDRVTGAKRLQHLSGLGHSTYWLSHFLYDMLRHSVSVGLCVAIIAAFQLSAFTFRENLAAVGLLLLLFGYATLPWMYLLSRVFSSPDAAFVVYVSLNFVCGLCTLLMTTMPRLLAVVSKAQNLQETYDVLQWAFRVFPQFCLGQGLVELCYHQIRYDLAHSLGVDAYASPFAMSFLGRLFVPLAVQGTALLLLRVLVHGDLVQRTWGRATVQGAVTSCEDTDVEEEQRRVLEGRTAGDVLVLCNLSKSHRGLVRTTAAVRGVSVGVRRGECFGLLGGNGAGKTTVFRMLSGDTVPSSGHAVIRTPTGEDVALSAAGRAGLRVGYCPQQDALDQLLTGREHLQYYCRLRGIPKPCVPQVTGDLARRLHLEAHLGQLVATYSGGTRRKLSAALALLGRPDLLLLDEPSSGMDACSKRLLWEAVAKEAQDGCAVVLTSHSMEECEALCTRLAIMVHGRFRCLGSPRHVTHRFGAGHTVRVWLGEAGGRRDAVSGCLRLHFPGTRFQGQRLSALEYHVPKRAGTAADLLQVLEDNKAALGLRHFSVSQAPLEQVFIDFASERTTPPPPGPPAGGDRPHLLPEC